MTYLSKKEKEKNITVIMSATTYLEYFLAISTTFRFHHFLTSMAVSAP